MPSGEIPDNSSQLVATDSGEEYYCALATPVFSETCVTRTWENIVDRRP